MHGAVQSCAGVYQLGTDALEREIRLGARHDTEATLTLLAAVASSRATHGQFWQAEGAVAAYPHGLAGWAMGFALPNSGACDVVGPL